MKILLSNNAVLCFLFSCLVIAALLPPDEVAVIDSSPVSEAPKTSAPQKSSTVRFMEQSLMWGVEFEHQSRIGTLSSIEDSYASGGCVLDFNQDGFQDLLIVAGPGVTKRYGREHWWLSSQKTVLYQNIGGLYFEDVSHQILREEVTGFGCTSRDINHDSVPDIAVGLKGAVRLFLSGDQGYKPYHLKLASPNALTTSLQFDDINNDGRQDLLVSTLVDYQRDIKVGQEEYRYHLGGEFAFEGFAPSNNALFVGQEGRIGSPFSSVLPFGQFRTFSIAPNSLEKGDSNRSYLLANATGSASKLFNPLANQVDSNQTAPHGRAAVQYSRITVGNTGHWLVTGGENTGLELFRFGSPRKNLARELGIQTSELTTLSGWGTLVADFDNNGMEDVVVAVGYHTPSINSKYRPQSGHNVLLLQQHGEWFSNQSKNFVPMLSRSSRGAAYADFNNDGFLDVVFFNNNGFASLFINQGNGNSWISFDCRPASLCDGSTWQLMSDGTFHEQVYDKTQPYLSSTQNRVHFGLGTHPTNTTLRVQFSSGKELHFSGLETERVYRVDLESGESVLYAPKQQARSVSHTWESLFHQVMGVQDEQELRTALQRASPLSDNELSMFIGSIAHSVGMRDGQPKSDFRLVNTVNWVLSHVLQYDLSSLSTQSVEDLLDIIIHTEQKVFVDYVAPLFEQLDDKAFCHLTYRLSYWFEEEEILPNTKQLLYAPLLKAGSLGSRNKFVCAVEGLSFSEEPTLGSTITGHLADEDPVVRAASLRALSRLKYYDAFEAVSLQCDKESDAIVLLECEIYIATLQPDMTSNPDVVNETHTALIKMYPKAVALNDGAVVMRLLRAENEALLKHAASPIPFHKSVALYFLLRNNEPGELASVALGSLREQEALEFARLLHRIDPDATDVLLSKQLEKGRLSPHQSLPYMSNAALMSLLSSREENSYSISFLLAMMKQCGERKALFDACSRIWNEGSYAQLGFKGQKLRLLYEADALGSALISNRLYTESLLDVDNKTLMEIIYWSDAYQKLDIAKLEGEWLDAFIEYSFVNRLELSSVWLLQLQKTKKKLDSFPWADLLVKTYER